MKVNSIRFCIYICVFFSAFFIACEKEVCAESGRNLYNSSPTGSQKEVTRIVNRFIESLLSRNPEDYLNLLDKDNFRYISQLVTSDSSDFVFNYHDEKKAIESTFARVEFERKNSKIVVKNEFAAEVSFKMDVLELYDKSLQYKQSIYHLNGVFVFRLVKDKKGNLKIQQIEEKIDNKEHVAISFGFIKYIHSDLFLEKLDKKRKSSVVRGEEFEERDYTTKYIDKKSKKTIWSLKLKQLWRLHIPEESDTSFVDAAGNKIANIESLE
jgi:hypothetical protein